MKVSNVLEHTALLGEGPIWDHRSGTIIWVDILRSQVMQFNPETKAFQISNVGKNISALAIRKDGGFVAAARNGFGWLDLKKPSFTYVSQPEIELQNNRFNDGKCDPRGRFWAGSMDCKDGKTLCGSLYSIDSKLSPLIKIEHVGCSNGLAWSPDCAIFYYIDTPTRQVVDCLLEWLERFEMGPLYRKFSFKYPATCFPGKLLYIWGTKSQRFIY